MTPLHLAACVGHVKCCEVIIKSVKEKNPVDVAGDTPLHAAAENGHVECCQIILQYAKDKNPRNLAGKTPAQLASVKTYAKVKGLKRLPGRGSKREF